MKKMKVARGAARELRRAGNSYGLSMKPPSSLAQAAIEADRQRANRKLVVKLYHKSGAGIA